MTFKIHSSNKLKNLYKKNHHQGAQPKNAKIIFIGSDANWDENIESSNIWKEVKEYLTDGVSYWEKYGRHHPFLSPTYNGDGKKYHSRFSKMNLQPYCANKISFVELVKFPTVGMRSKNLKLFKELLLSNDNREWLHELSELLEDETKIFYLPFGILTECQKLNQKLGLFKSLEKIDKKSLTRHTVNFVNNFRIFEHFSNTLKDEGINKMALDIKSFTNKRISFLSLDFRDLMHLIHQNAIDANSKEKLKLWNINLTILIPSILEGQLNEFISLVMSNDELGNLRDIDIKNDRLFDKYQKIILAMGKEITDKDKQSFLDLNRIEFLRDEINLCKAISAHLGELPAGLEDLFDILKITPKKHWNEDIFSSINYTKYAFETFENVSSLFLALRRR